MSSRDSLVLELEAGAMAPSFFYGSGDPNSGLHIHRASMLLTTTSPSLNVICTLSISPSISSFLSRTPCACAWLPNDF